MQSETTKTPSPYLERFLAMDYYELLDVPRDASFDAIGLAYRSAIQMYNPLSVAIYSILTPEDTVAMTELVEKAYKILRDPVDRRKYDKDLEQAPLAQTAATEPPLQIAAVSELPGPVQRSFSFLAPVYAVEHVSETWGMTTISTELPMKSDDAVLPPEPLTGVPAVQGLPPAEEPAIVDKPQTGSQPPAETVASKAFRATTAAPQVVDVMMGTLPAEEGPVDGQTRTAVPAAEKPQPDQQPEGALKSGLEKSWFVQTQQPGQAAVHVQAEELTDVPSVKTETQTPAAAPKAAEKPAAEAAAPALPEKEEEPQIGPDTIFSGPLLRKIRKRQGLDLGDIAAITRVTKANIQFIEDETYKDLPALVYIRGYLNLFARCLKLDPKRVASTYIQRMQNSGPDGQKE